MHLGIQTNWKHHLSDFDHEVNRKQTDIPSVQNLAYNMAVGRNLNKIAKCLYPKLPSKLHLSTHSASHMELLRMPKFPEIINWTLF